ncbi:MULTISPECIES: YdcF family protein [Pseudofrankia]|uniref:YdcF family protein n=1 Tax=Pseudofrankia TaxID=2994363 RepID=UPI000D09293B|nr:MULTISPECIES: YdcF family protein [Pseudofrankia]
MLVVAVVGVIALAGLVVGTAEIPHWAASRRHLDPLARRPPRTGVTRPDLGTDSASAGEGDGGTATGVVGETVLVLGYPSARDGRTHPLQRWRTEIAVRSMSHDGSQAGDQARGQAHDVGGRAGMDGTSLVSDGALPVSDGTLLVFSGAATRGAVIAEAEAMARYAREVLGVPPEQIVLETQAHTTKQNLAFAMTYLESAATIKIASDPLHAARARRYLRQLRPDLACRLVAADDYRPLEKLPLKLGTVAYEVTRPALRHVMPPLRTWHQERIRRRANRAAG